MHIIGLAGAAGSGKDTVAKHLRRAHGYKVFSFSDALYREVSEAFGVPIEFLQDRRSKETRADVLCLAACIDRVFSGQVYRLLKGRINPSEPLSPRQVLQWWGTEYRRGQNPRYWLNCATDWLLTEMVNAKADAPWLRFANTSVRYPNEAEWIREIGGEIWHVRRDSPPPIEQVASEHSSEIPLKVGPQDTVIHNNGSIDSLWTAVTMKLSQPNAREIRVESEETE